MPDQSDPYKDPEIRCLLRAAWFQGYAEGIINQSAWDFHEENVYSENPYL
jgi:hypothetical protein